MRQVKFIRLWNYRIAWPVIRGCRYTVTPIRLSLTTTLYLPASEHTASKLPAPGALNRPSGTAYLGEQVAEGILKSTGIDAANSVAFMAWGSHGQRAFGQLWAGEWVTTALWFSQGLARQEAGPVLPGCLIFL